MSQKWNNLVFTIKFTLKIFKNKKKYTNYIFLSIQTKPNRSTVRISALVCLVSTDRSHVPVTTAVVSGHYRGVVVDPATQVEEGPSSRSADPYSLEDEGIQPKPQAAHTCIAIAVQLLRLIAVICRLSVLKCCCLVVCEQNSTRDAFSLTNGSALSVSFLSLGPQHFTRFK